MNYNLIFIGREKELAKFKSMLERENKYWVFALSGDGGEGKTCLLRRLVELVKGREMAHSDLIDFYHTDLQTETGLLRSAGSSLGMDHFFQLKEALERCGAGPAAAREEALNVAVDRFVSGIRDLASGGTVVIFFDTFEKATETGVAEWFLEEVLPQLRGSAVVVLAGRNAFELAGDDEEVTEEEEEEYVPAIMPLPAEDVLILSLAPFSLSEVHKYLSEYLTRRGEGDVPLEVDPDRYSDLDEPPAEVETIWEKSQGHPVVVALAADWLAEWGVGSIMDLADFPPEEFERAMVSKIRDLESPDDEAIARMAHVYHRFNALILDMVYPRLREEGFDPEQVIQDLSRLSFVKYWPETGVCLLHDEMQRMVDSYVWSEIDPVRDVRREISANAVKYYDRALERETDERARWVLEAQRAYHRMYSDLDKGRPEFWHTADYAWSQYKLDFVTMLLSAAREVNAKLRDLLLDVMCQLIEAWVKLEEWDLKEARKLAESARKHPACTMRIRASALTAVGVYADRTGDSDLALEHYREALELYRDLEERLVQGNELSAEHGIPQLRGVRTEIAMLLNRIGIVWRKKGLFDDAFASYQRGLGVAQQEDDLEWLAAAVNNIGNVERLRGNLPVALIHCQQALQYREGLNQKQPGAAYLRDIGLSHNTLGMVLRDMREHGKAEEHFMQAEELFEQVHDRSGMVRVIRNIGWVCYLKGKLTDSESERRKLYTEALRHYKRSRKVCKEFDIEPELPNLLNKIGIVQRALGNTEEAQQSFSESLELSRDLNDNLFIANNLVRLAEMAYASGDLEQVAVYAGEVFQYQKKGFHFGLAYAEMEELMALVALDAGEYEEAIRRMGENYAYLARLNRWRFDRKVDDLREFFKALPDEWRRQGAEQLIHFWKDQGLAEEYADLTAICGEYTIEEV
jgi:tetratricopeptide (TPR) repeat protein